MIDYRSDNTGRAAPEILGALVRANCGTALGYGADEWTARLQGRFSELFETRVRVFPVATGTAANALSIAASSPSWGLVYCSEAAHINTAEAKRIFDQTWPARRSWTASPSANSGLNTTIASHKAPPFLVAPNERMSTPERQLISAGLHESRASALAKRAPSMCSLSPRALPISATLRISSIG